MTNKLKRLFLMLIMLTSVAACQAGSMSKEIVSEAFIDLFDYEIQNRAFALNSMKATVKNGVGTEALPFFIAYLALEDLNQQRLVPVAKKYHLDTAPRLWTRTRTQVGLWVTALIPETAMKTIHKATVKCVDQLQNPEQLASQDDKSFFAYVVAQERLKQMLLVC